MIRALGLLAAAALGLGSPGCTWQVHDSRPAIIANLTDSRPWDGEKRLEVRVHFGEGHIIVGAGPENTLYNLDADYDSTRFKARLDYDAPSNHLDIRLDSLHDGGDGENIHLGFGSKNSSKNRLNLRLSPKTLLSLTIKAGVGETKVDLSGLQTSELDLESGVSSTFLSCDTPNQTACERLHFRAGVGKFEALQLGNLHFRKMDFEGGVGSSQLDFSGQWHDDGDVSVKMGVGELVIKLPSQIGAEVHTEKSFLSGLHLDSFTKQGDRYISDNFQKTSQHVRFELKTGIGSIRVLWL